MQVDRSRITVKPLTSDDDEYVDATPEERVMMVWPLTQEIWSVYKPGHAERRLQRDITAIKRSKG